MSSHKFNCVSILAPLFIFCFCLSTSFPAHAQSDSVMIVLREKKVVIQINESGASSRLQSLFDVLQQESEFLFLSEDESVKLDCGRNAEAATCTFRFLPSNFVSIGPKDLDVFISWNQLNVTPTPSAEGQWLFESSRNDRLEIQVTSKGLRVLGSKKN